LRCVAINGPSVYALQYRFEDWSPRSVIDVQAFNRISLVSACISFCFLLSTSSTLTNKTSY